MSYESDGPRIDDSHAVAEAAIKAVFDSDPRTDWVMVGSTSGTIFDYGRNAARFTDADVKVFSGAFGETLHVIARPEYIEPTHPDPNVPPER